MAALILNLINFAWAFVALERADFLVAGLVSGPGLFGLALLGGAYLLDAAQPDAARVAARISLVVGAVGALCVPLMVLG